MAEFIQPLLSKQDALNFKLAFEKVGFDRVDSSDVSVATLHLEKQGKRGIEQHEVVITSLPVQENKGNLGSFVKFMVLSHDRVKLFWFGRKNNGKVNWSCGNGLLLITNDRIILLEGNAKTKEFTSVRSSNYRDLGMDSVGYEQDNLLVECNDSRNLIMSFDFPRASPLFALTSVGLGDKTESDYLSTAQNQRSVEQYNSKGVDAKGLIHQFFLILIEAQNSKNDFNSTTEMPSDVADLIRKLHELKDAGILSDMEFDAKKQELLKRI